ncbi:glutamyl-tRNA amidotransferase [Usnea florida]
MKMRFFTSPASLVALPCIFHNLTTAISITITGQTLVLNDVPYYLPAASFATLPFFASLKDAASAVGFVPVTVVELSTSDASQSGLEHVIDRFGADDVWNSGFLEAVLVSYATGAKATVPLNASIALPGANTSRVISLPKPNDSSITIPSGPYFLSTSGSLYQPLRLYSDFAGAFTQPLISTSNSTYTALPANVAGIQSPAVGVPSRLYYTKTAKQPLAGVRLGVKDIFDVAGVRTSDGNRAWYGLFPPASINAVPVQRLVDAGAVIVGKMKTSQFANGETATADWVDYHSPFNPRGDGYQDPSSSSSGPGAGEGSYPWLDLGLGSDTGGSIRGPSQVQGLFGNRPSHGLVDLTGVMPLAPQLDTAGFLARDPATWVTAAKVLYPDLAFYSQYPKILYTVDFPTSADSEADAVVLNFLTKLEGFLSVSSTPLNLSTLWASKLPAGADPSLDEFLNITYPILISKEQTALVRDPFYAAYAAVHDGRRPFIDPVPLIRWAFGDSYPNSTLTQAVTNKTIFQDWWSTNVQRNDSATCSDSLLLYTAGADPLYRNEYNGPPQVPYGFGTSRISPFAEVPDFVIPIGSAAYNSTITLHTEYLPVTIDILAAKGCDGLIFNLVQDLQAAGIVNASLTGQTITAGGKILLRM